MTWLKGQTTWANLADDLVKLACGEMADGAGVTVAAGDAWVRNNALATVNSMRSPASVDRPSGAMSMRCGYWALVTPGANGFGLQTWMRMQGLRTTPTRRMVYYVRIHQANSVANDYSTAGVQVYCYDADDMTALIGGNTYTPNAAGDITFDGMTIRIGDPTGLVTLNAKFFRAFTPEFPGGIDHFPMYYKRAAAAAFSTPPPGVEGTDWAVTELAPVKQLNDNNGNYTAQVQNQVGGRRWFTGLGIKTATGLGANPVYVYSHPIALHVCRILNSANAGQLSLTYGRTAVDGRAGLTALADYRRTTGNTITQWARPFATPAQVTAAAAVSYWMSVKPDGIMLVLSGDPGLTGKVSASWVGVTTPYDANYDKFPTMFNRTLYDHTAGANDYQNFDQGYEFNYWSQRRRQDGTEGARDWQTGWSRCDLFEYGNSWTGDSSYDDQTPEADAWGTHSYAGQMYGHPSILPVRQLKPHPYDAKWWLYGVAFGDNSAWDNYGSPANPGTMDHRQIRGVVNTRWWYLPGDGWANLDELTDQSTGAKYLLVAADYNGIAGRNSLGGGVYAGGAAVAEV